MEEIALNNLKVLTHPTKLAANQYTIQGNSLITSDGDSFDTIYEPKDLEYPVYFTFHQLMNHVHSSYGHQFHGHTRKQLINLMIDALDNLCEYYESTDMKYIPFGEMINDLDDKVFFIQQYYRYGWCLWLPTKIKEYLNWVCVVAVGASKEIVKDYIQEMKDPGGYISEHDGQDSDDSNDSDYSTEENESNDSSEDIPDLDESEHSKED